MGAERQSSFRGRRKRHKLGRKLWSTGHERSKGLVPGRASHSPHKSKDIQVTGCHPPVPGRQRRAGLASVILPSLPQLPQRRSLQKVSRLPGGRHSGLWACSSTRLELVSQVDQTVAKTSTGEGRVQGAGSCCREEVSKWSLHWHHIKAGRAEIP